MLVLSRKPGERIVFPDLGITVMVVAVQGDKVRLAIEAPRDVVVHREEVWQAIERERIEAAYTEHGGEAGGA